MGRADMNEQLDQAIDDVAQAMTAAEPPATLRADVLAGIERERTRRQIGGLLPRWAWAAAAAVVVLGVASAVWVLRPAPEPTQLAANTPGSTVAAAAPPVDAPSPSSAVPAATPAGPRAAVRPQPTSRPGLPDDAGPSPLTGPAAIEIAPLGPEAIAVPGIAVGSLTEIEPLTLSTIGPGSPEPQRRDRE